MKTYIAQWPDGTITIVDAEDKTDLFWKLDTEADPIKAKIFEVPYGDGGIHITTNLTTNKKGEPTIEFNSGEYGEELKRAKWPKGTTLKAMQQFVPETTEELTKQLCPQLGLTYK
jgi:hypothetical protein